LPVASSIVDIKPLREIAAISRGLAPQWVKFLDAEHGSKKNHISLFGLLVCMGCAKVTKSFLGRAPR
jgi:hypothetical protein